MPTSNTATPLDLPSTDLPRLPGVPVNEQEPVWVGEQQVALGYPWERIAGPGRVREVIRQVRRHREGDALQAETRVRSL